MITPRKTFLTIFTYGILALSLFTARSVMAAPEDAITTSTGSVSTPNTEDKIASLRFNWNAPVNMAAFKRNDKIWIVFDRPNRFDAQSLEKESLGLAKQIFTLPHPGGSIVIIEPEDGVKYSLRKEGLLWIVDLYTGRPPKFEVKNVTIFTQYDSLKQSYLFVPNQQTGNTLSIIDPDMGDIISISTTSELGLGFNSFYRYPDFDILPTSQGMAFVINSPDLILNRGNSGITLKARGRSLNITSNLDALKRNQKQTGVNFESSHSNAFYLQIPQNQMDGKFIDVVDSIKKQIMSAPPEIKNTLRMDLARYYIYNGLGIEALYILNQMRKLNLPETQGDRFYALSGIANFLARRYKEAVSDFSHGKLQETQEGIFWKTIAQSAYETDEKNNSVLFAHISLMRDYPQAIKDEVAIIAARNAIATGDDLSSQNFIDILSSVPDRAKDLAPQITYLAAQRMEMQGYIRNAIKEYKKILNSNSAMFSSYARLNHTILSQLVNYIDTKEAIQELEKLRYAWGDKEFKITLLNKLSDMYLKDKDYYNALKTLNDELYFTSAAQRNPVIRKMVKIFEDIFVSNHADENLSPIKSLALYNDFKWLAKQSNKRNIIVQKLSDRLVSVDLLPRAQELLFSLLTRDDLSNDNKARVGSRLAIIYLFDNKPQEALDILEATDAPNLKDTTINPRRVIAARAYTALGRKEDALNILSEDFSKNSILNRFEIYWNSGDWDNASNTIKYLIEEPKPGQKLSQEQVGYILDWATTLKQAGKETVLVRLRNKFTPYFKDTPYAGVFNVLTNHLEKDEVNLKAINTILNDVNDFNNFSKFYTDSLKESNLE